MSFPLPPNEQQRLEELRRFALLDTPPEKAFDNITELAARIFATPMAAVTLIDEDRQWFKSCVGWKTREVGRHFAFCAHAIMGTGVMVVPDAREDARFAESPLVVGPPNIRFYAGAPLRTRNGLNLGTLTISDTKPRQMTEESSATLAALAALVVSEIELRYEIGQHRRTRESFRLLQEAIQQRSEFLTRMSHELRTPLHAILGYSHLLEMDGLSVENKESVNYIIRAGNHLLGLINGIARVEAGKLALTPEPVNVRETLEEAIILVKPQAAERLVRLEPLIGDLDCEVLASVQHLRQVVLDLLSNAVKFNRAGGSVAISGEKRGDCLRIKIADTGRGITLENMKKLFVPFERLDVSNTLTEGAGLALSLSKHLIETMGGRIGLESVVGLGTTFWVELPLVQSTPESNM